MIESDNEMLISLGVMAEMFLHESKKKKKKSSLARYKDKHGIVSVSNPKGSIGYSEKEKKWYGWSHRAIHGFGIGHKVEKGHLPTCFVGQTAKTLDDAKRFAVSFSRVVS